MSTAAAQTSGSVGLPVPTPMQLIGKPVKNRREIWDCPEKLSWVRGNVKTTTFGSGSITLGVTRGAPGADGFNKEGYNDQVVPGCLSQGDQEQCAKLWELLQDEGRALGFEFSSAQLNKTFLPMHPPPPPPHGQGPPMVSVPGRIHSRRVLLAGEGPMLQRVYERSMAES